MRRWLTRLGLVLLALLVLAAAALPAVIGIRPIIGPRARPLTDRTFERTPERLERGRYLATSVSGCIFCHGETDWNAPGFTPRPGTEGSGRSWAEEGIPWLTVPNITPDPDTGAGRWTDDMLARGIREGIGHDGRALFPLMPYHQYQYMSDEDLASIIVYIRSLPPVRKAVPPSQIPFPVNRFINAVPEPVAAPVPEPNRSSPAAYGDYLVRIGVCRDCHSTADANGQAIPGMEFAGGTILPGPYGEIASPNITQDPSGIPYYTEELFLEMMRTGMVKARKIHDRMPWKLCGQQTDDDLKAMFAYLKTIAPVQHRVDNSLPPTDCPRCGLRHGAGSQNQPAEEEE
jgi:mono/diheme cytochrome c family protein